MSRGGIGGGDAPEGGTPPAGTPIWIGIVYFLGAVGAIMLGYLLAMKLATAFFWDDAPDFDASTPLVVFWGALTAGAIGLWVYRRRA